jgi:hypothetical protein
MAIAFEKTIPLFRIVDVAKAKAQASDTITTPTRERGNVNPTRERGNANQPDA